METETSKDVGDKALPEVPEEAGAEMEMARDFAREIIDRITGVTQLIIGDEAFKEMQSKTIQATHKNSPAMNDPGILFRDHF